MSHRIFTILFIIIFNTVQSQKRDSLTTTNNAIKTEFQFYTDSIMLHEASEYKITEDSISVILNPIYVQGMPKFNNTLDKDQYSWLKKKVFRVYPYFIIALKQYNNISDTLNMISNKSAYKKYSRKRQKQLSEEFEGKLKSLTKAEGKIFSKLMYRSTGKTVYEIIKELRNGWSAFWWNAKAVAFDIDLKEPFDPYHIRDDAFVEAILLRAFQSGELTPTEELE
ncbi:DUF4294 domain-containing protein [uncultured Apibacter sp.]|uniref:DUF4294 domain-containing protein n=1 Tax=uncultured Apibacter sp. TaxID=1778616 RepID=UPI0025F1E95F|nr:DUF4294 domain-containing protein [uncultured Apibacter sp.]